MDSVRSGQFGQIFRPDNFIFGQVRAWRAPPLPARDRPLGSAATLRANKSSHTCARCYCSSLLQPD